MNKTFKSIIQEICIEENIKLRFLSKDWLMMLEKDGKTRFISGYKFDLNSHGLGLVVDDKFALFEVLKEKNIPVTEHKIVYNKTNTNDYAIGSNTYEYVKVFLKENNNNIVIKPNNGSCGHNVYNVRNENEIDNILDKIFKSNYSISICPFYDIKHEYRVLVLDGEVRLIFTKYLPIVIGDGEKSIRKLLQEFNYDFFIEKLQDSKYDRILNKNETFQYNWKFNLAQGSIAKKLDNNELKEKLENLAKNICKKIDFRFGSIDIIETINNELLVLELNSGVMLENYLRLNPDEYEAVKDIYKCAINKMFI